MPSQPNEQHYISVCMPFLKQFSFVTGCYNSSSIQQYLSKSTNFSISSPALCQEYCLQKDIYKFAIQVCCKPTSVDMFFFFFFFYLSNYAAPQYTIKKVINYHVFSIERCFDQI